MATRVLHCGNSLENYYTCINEKVAGFTRRVAAEGDTIYLAVKLDKVSYCGTRAVLSSVTDFKPWEDYERYSQAFMLKDIEYCTPFNLQVLSEAGGQYWAVKYIQSSKINNDERAIEILTTSFSKNQTPFPC